MSNQAINLTYRFIPYLVALASFAAYVRVFANDASLFRDQVFAGLFAVAAGIPAGLLLDSYRRKADEKDKDIERKKQEHLILIALTRELDFNLRFFLKSRKSVLESVCAQRFCVEIWNSLSQSGKLSHVDSDVLVSLSEAYDLVRKMNDLENNALVSFTNHPTTIRLTDGTTKTGWQVLVSQARTLDIDFEQLVTFAIEKASTRLKLLI